MGEERVREREEVRDVLRGGGCVLHWEGYNEARLWAMELWSRKGCFALRGLFSTKNSENKGFLNQKIV